MTEAEHHEIIALCHAKVDEFLKGALIHGRIVGSRQAMYPARSAMRSSNGRPPDTNFAE